MVHETALLLTLPNVINKKKKIHDQNVDPVIVAMASG